MNPKCLSWIPSQGNFTAEADAARDNFEKQAVEKMKSMLMVLPTMPTEYLKCDPTEHKAGITYLEITKLLQVLRFAIAMHSNKVVKNCANNKDSNGDFNFSVIGNTKMHNIVHWYITVDLLIFKTFVIWSHFHVVKFSLNHCFKSKIYNKFLQQQQQHFS